MATAGSRLLRAAVALTGSRAAAEDLVQEVLERLFVAWPHVNDPMAYAHRVLVNQCRNRWRHAARHPEVLGGLYPEQADSDLTEAHDRRDALVRALATLPRRQRAVLVLRFLSDLSEADTASAMRCSVGTVKSQTARALGRLRVVMDPAPDPADIGRSSK